MSNKKQTAVEWLFDNLNLCFDKFDNGEYSYTEFVNASNEIKEQAKTMEKEQTINSHIEIIKQGLIEEGQIKWEEGYLPKIKKLSEQYYKETYGE